MNTGAVASLRSRTGTPDRFRRHRSGFSLFEVLVSGLLIGAVVTFVVPVLGWMVRERALGRERQAAMLEAGNLMERLAAVGYDDLTPERAATFGLSEALQQQLHDARLAIAVEPDRDERGAKRLVIELRWSIAPGREAPAVRLVTWIYRQGREV